MQDAKCKFKTSLTSNQQPATSKFQKDLWGMGQRPSGNIRLYNLCTNKERTDKIMSESYGLT
jgi:hypothetical protein